MVPSPVLAIVCHPVTCKARRFLVTQSKKKGRYILILRVRRKKGKGAHQSIDWNMDTGFACSGKSFLFTYTCMYISVSSIANETLLKSTNELQKSYFSQATFLFWAFVAGIFDSVVTCSYRDSIPSFTLDCRLSSEIESFEIFWVWYWQAHHFHSRWWGGGGEKELI